MVLREVEKLLLPKCPEAPPGARFGGITFIHQFGSALNIHLHFHCCIIDGIFAAQGEGIQFYETTALNIADIARVQERVRKRVLRLFERRGFLTREEARAMGQWAHGGGFSIDAKVRIVASDRAGLERLLRYCARPIFAGERLSWMDVDEQLLYHLPKPLHDGQTVLILTPFEFLERIAALIPPPRRHRHRYHGVLAPNSPLRSQVTARAGSPIDEKSDGKCTSDTTQAEDREEQVPSQGASYLWAMLLARIYEVFPLICPHCGAELRIIAFLTESDPIVRILDHIGEP